MQIYYRRSQYFFFFLLKNRSSLWNKACDELKKHQEFVAKVKATMPDFHSEPNFGDPFTSDEIKEFLTSLVESDHENEDDGDEATKEELEQVHTLKRKSIRPSRFSSLFF